VSRDHTSNFNSASAMEVPRSVLPVQPASELLRDSVRAPRGWLASKSLGGTHHQDFHFKFAQDSYALFYGCDREFTVTLDLFR